MSLRLFKTSLLAVVATLTLSIVFVSAASAISRSSSSSSRSSSSSSSSRSSSPSTSSSSSSSSSSSRSRRSSSSNSSRRSGSSSSRRSASKPRRPSRSAIKYILSSRKKAIKRATTQVKKPSVRAKLKKQLAKKRKRRTQTVLFVSDNEYAYCQTYPEDPSCYGVQTAYYAQYGDDSQYTDDVRDDVDNDYVVPGDDDQSDSGISPIFLVVAGLIVLIVLGIIISAFVSAARRR